MSKRVQLAVIGLGWVGTHRHLPFLCRNRQVNVVGVVDRNAARVAAAQKQFGVQLGCDDAAAIPFLDTIDAVSIATPPDTHFALAQQMLLAGKHVLLEKPMAMSVADGEALVALAQTQDRTLALVHNFQFARSVMKLKRLISGGKLGEIRSIEATQLSSPDRRLPIWCESLPLGLFYDESPHLLYLIDALTEQTPALETVHVVPSRHGRETPAMVTAHYLSGRMPIRLSMNFESPISEWQLMVLGSKALAIADIFRDILIVVPHDGQHAAHQIIRSSLAATLGHWGGTLWSGVRMMRGTLDYGNHKVQSAFVDAVRTGQPLTNGIGPKTGLRILSMQHEIIKHVS